MMSSIHLFAPPMFAGCAYRQRTGACTCDNPPIGCVRDALPRPVGLSFPSDITSYAELRAFSTAQPPARPQPPPREVTPRGPQPLPLRAGRLPPLGWRVAEHLHSSLTCHDLLCYADEEATKAASTGSQAVCCVVPSVADLSSCRARLGRAPAAVLLRCGSDPTLWEAQWADLHAAAAPSLPGLAVPDAVIALDALRRLMANGSPLPALISVPLSPTSPAAHRALVGLCRRTGVLLLALQPLGDAALRSHPDVVAASADRAGGVHEALLAWCIAKGALPVVECDDGSADQLAQLLAALMEQGNVMDLDAGERAALDGRAS